MEKLDRDILDWIASHTADDNLSAQIRVAQVARRDFMRTGFFVYFKPASDLEEVAHSVRPSCPRVVSRELMDGAGCTLFLRNGRLHYLEIYARGGFLPKDLGEYQLQDDE